MSYSWPLLTDDQGARVSCVAHHAAHFQGYAEEAAGSCLLQFGPAKICDCVFKFKSEHNTVIAPGQYRLTHTQLGSPLYLKHKRHLVVTFTLTLSAGLGLKMDVPILPTKAKPVCEADLAWAWVFLSGKSVVSFQMWIRVWAGVWLGSRDSSGYELGWL